MLQCLFYILFLFVYLNYADKFQENVLEQIIPIFPSISYKADDLRDIANNAYDDPPSMIERQGYKAETHKVATDDSYILQMHRIPPIKKKYTFCGCDELENSVVFLMHGFSGSSADWIITGPESALAYYLVEKNFDVWMGNARGNKYSKRHLELYMNIEKDKAKFWEFSLHETGVLDLPSMIDYILELTGKDKIYYIGHSTGATAFFILCSEKPEYNDKIEMMFALAPVAFMSNIKSPYLNTVKHNLKKALEYVGRYEFFPESTVIHETTFTTSKVDNISEYLHEFVTESSHLLITGMNKDNTDYKQLPVIMAHIASGTSAKVLLHLIQLMDAGDFVQYNYGLFLNLKHYLCPSPPAYDLTKVTTPVLIIYSRSDWLSSEEDITRLYTTLPTTLGKYLVREKRFSSNDFLWGMSTKSIINEKVVKLLDVLCSSCR